MGMTTAMRDALAAATIGDTFQAFNNSNAYLGVGDSATAFVNTQTDLQAATNKLRKAMDATFPTRAANVLTFKATFGPSDANFAWAEWGVFNASSALVMLCRAVASNGTKGSGSTWVATATVTYAVA